MGVAWTVRAKRPYRLITWDIYKYIRHPIYTFSFTLWIGVFMVLNPWWAWIVTITVPFQLYRARREERLLAACFGSDWYRYKKGTWF